MAEGVRLRLVEDAQEIADCVHRFAQGIEEDPGRERVLISQSTYWVFFPATGEFGPSKFVGFAGMDFDRYERVLEMSERPNVFSGRKARRQIERVLGQEFAQILRLNLELVDWGREISPDEDLFGSVDQTKWRFVHLPADVQP